MILKMKKVMVWKLFNLRKKQKRKKEKKLDLISENDESKQFKFLNLLNYNFTKIKIRYYIKKQFRSD